MSGGASAAPPDTPHAILATAGEGSLLPRLIDSSSAASGTIGNPRAQVIHSR